MNSAIERLLTLRVCDIMNRNVVTVEQNQTMAEAAAVLNAHGVSGVPVVDHAGRVVGVLSNSDYTLREKERSQELEHGSGGPPHRVESSESDPTGVHIEAYAEDCVREHMSPLVQTVDSNATMMNAARVMCGEHIHRLVIIDETNRPVGVVSSLDIVATMVGAIEE